jgi:hypothetical protein
MKWFHNIEYVPEESRVPGYRRDVKSPEPLMGGSGRPIFDPSG